MALDTPRMLVDGLGFPEAPRWHDDRLWFVDLLTRQVLTVTLDGDVSVFTEMEHWPMGIGFLPDGAPVVVSMADCRLVRFDGSSATEYADMSAVTRGHLNDLVIDGVGRAYASDTGGLRQDDGTVVLGDRRRSNISLFVAGGPPRVVAADLDLSNGLAITADGTKLVVSETLGERLTAFTIAEDGSLVDSRTFAKLPGEEPNGLCSDAEGAIWVASHHGCYLRVKEGGDIVERVVVPGGAHRRAVACMLGGVDGRQLFMLSADGIPGADDVRANVLRTGRIDVMTVEVPGAGWP